MLIIGEGALFTRAVQFCLDCGFPVDGLVSRVPLPERLLNSWGIPFLRTPDVNQDATFLQAHCQDGLVWSINNPTILKSSLLTLPGFRYLNIHNGLVQTCRGLPEVSIFFSILQEAPIYGVTLHQIDQGIDTGPVLAQRFTTLSGEDTFESIMTRTLDLCGTILEEECPRVLGGACQPMEIDKRESRNYNYRMLPEAEPYRASPAWFRAVALGKYRVFFPRLMSWISTFPDQAR